MTSKFLPIWKILLQPIKHFFGGVDIVYALKSYFASSSERGRFKGAILAQNY